MNSQAERSVAAPTAAQDRSALRLSRSISATWWYVTAGILVFQLSIVLFAMAAFATDGFSKPAVWAVGAGGLLWLVGSVVPLLDYRHRTNATPLLIWRRHLAPLVIGAVFGLAAGLASGVWVLGFLPVIQVVSLLNWPPGVRFRLVLLVTGLLVALSFVDARVALAGTSNSTWYQVLFFCAVLPIITVSSLWWWDVVITLDRARASEAKLAATQERLRLATDVHDLQGHHLQVIALQLELAERLMPRDPAAGMEQLGAARGSVDGARQGTRDLATRFRSVPLRDELANAVDLLHAGDMKAVATVDPDAAQAPASVLGPVIRETTTNVLRHGGGRWARLSLVRSDGSWRYEISNDAAGDGAAHEAGSTAVGAGGSGLEGVARRAAEAGGVLDVHREDGKFTVLVTVPDGPVEEEDAR